MLRTLNFHDVGQAHLLPADQVEQLGGPIVAKLRALPVVSSVDDAGIPHRGQLVYREAIGGHTAREMAAARRMLHQLRASYSVIDAVESVEVEGQS